MICWFDCRSTESTLHVLLCCPSKLFFIPSCADDVVKVKLLKRPPIKKFEGLMLCCVLTFHRLII